jgi:hypothetical protein
MTDAHTPTDLDVSNVYGVGVRAKNIVILTPPSQMTPDEAMVFAAWVVALASMHSTHPFSVYYDKVSGT